MNTKTYVVEYRMPCGESTAWEGHDEVKSERAARRLAKKAMERDPRIDVWIFDPDGELVDALGQEIKK